MDRIKRQKICHQSSGVKLRDAFKKKTCIENLSAEIFYEIFDYLDGYDIYNAFSNLNIRFQNFLNSSSFFMKIEFSADSVLVDHYEQFINLNKHHIISLHFYNQTFINELSFFSSIDSSWNYLKSVILNEISVFKFLVLLFHLKSVPHLSSLSVQLTDCDDNVGDIYQIIFRLPLKYFKLDISEYEPIHAPIPIATHEQFSSLEYLVINHDCTLNALIHILSQTPRLSHLHCYRIIESDDNIQSEILWKLTNLVHLHVDLYHLDFHLFEQFLLKLCSRLELLSVTIGSCGKIYLDSDIWEKLILENMIYLKKFIFSYTDIIYDNFQINPNYLLINNFTSSFWINRKWIFKLSVRGPTLVYSIGPYIKTWVDFQEYLPINQNSINNHYFPVIQFSVGGTLLTLNQKPLIYEINPIFEIIQLTCLNIYCEIMSISRLVELLSSLENLTALRISNPKLLQKMDLCDEDTEILDEFLKNNKITKLTLRNINEPEEIGLVIGLFPRIQYFALQSVSNGHLEIFLRCILLAIKKNDMSQSMTICIFGEEAEYNMLQKLRDLIDSEHLLEDYTIHRQFDRFYLQLK